MAESDTRQAVNGLYDAYVKRDGDRAAVVSEVRFKHHVTGRVLNFRLADIMRLRDGKIIEFEEFIDTIDVAEQALGRHLDLR